MKDKMKNTLEQEVELLGRSVSVLLIAGLLVVGGASAALLNQFATIDGEADVEQAFVVGDTGEAELDLANFDSDLTAGDTVVDGPVEVTNNLDTAYTPEVETQLESNDLDETETDETKIEWNENGDFLTTTFVDAFAEAGHDFSDYEDERPDSVDEEVEIDDEQFDFDGGESYLVDEVSVDSFEIDEDDVVLWADADSVGQVGSTEVRITDGTTGVEIRGFELEETDYAGAVDPRGDNDDTVIEYNQFVGDGDGVDAASGSDNIEVRNNEFTNDEVGVYLNGDLDSGVIDENTFESVRLPVGIDGNDDSEIISNRFLNSEDEAIEAFDDNDDLQVEENFFDNDVDIVFADNSGDDEGIDAGENFYVDGATVGGEYPEQIDEEYRELSDFEVEADSTIEVGLVNDFNIMASPDDYELTVTVDDGQ